MDIEFKIETTRTILNNAIKSKASYNTILEISQKLDKYIVEYTKAQKNSKNNSHIIKKTL